ncbi:MAG: acyltransferase [Clostridia bacterium]|nr:acyltransferase [Clostridia bacterium]
MEVKKKQYELLNALKIIAAFFVVAIHVHFPGNFGKGIIAVARFAVPFFFMVSGFFSFYENKEVLNVKYKRKIRHLCTIFAGSFLLYLAYDSFAHIMNGSLMNYLTNKFSIDAIIEFFVFNHPRVMEPLWFLLALVYATVVFFFFEKKGITKKMYFLIPVLFLAGVILRELLEFTENPPEIMTKAYLYRNWLFIGLPFFMFGHWIRANEEKLKNRFSDISLIVIMLIFTAEAVAVELLHTQKSLYIGTFFAVSALFIFVLKKEGAVSTGKLAVFGAEYSLYVYIFHIMVKNVIGKILSIGVFVPVGEKLSAVMPVIVFVITLIASAVYVYAKKVIKSKFIQEK